MVKISSDEISANWTLANIQDTRVISQSGQRTVYELISDEGRFILKVADPSKTEEDIKKDTFVFQFLKDRNFPYIPSLILTKEKTRYIKFDDQFAYILEYVGDKKADRTVENWAAIGKIAAQLHQIKDYPYQTAFTFTSERRKFPEIARQLPFGNEWLRIAKGLSNLDNLPQCLIHTDIGLNNVIQKADGTLVVIDWDDVGVGTRILDLGFPLICHFITEDLVFEKEKALAFYGNYTVEQQLTNEEKLALFDAGLLFALIYTPYGNTEKHWLRIKFALKNKELVSSVLQ